MMKSTIIFFMLMFLLSCNSNVKQNQNVAAIETVTDTTLINDSLDVWSVLHQSYCGIWNNFHYLDTLKKYNSVSITDSLFSNEIVQIQINKNEILVSTSISMEGFPINKERDNIKIENDTTLLLIEKNTRKTSTMKKNRCNKNYIDNDLFDYGINTMRFLWFYGYYEMLDNQNNIIGQVYFDEYGAVDGYGNMKSYCFGYDITKKDFIFLSNGAGRKQEYVYLLMEYQNGYYIFYDVHEFDDIEEPLMKLNFKFSLKKQKKVTGSGSVSKSVIM